MFKVTYRVCSRGILKKTSSLQALEYELHPAAMHFLPGLTLLLFGVDAIRRRSNADDKISHLSRKVAA